MVETSISKALVIYDFRRMFMPMRTKPFKVKYTHLLQVIWHLSLLFVFQTGLCQHQKPNIVLFIADDWSYPHAGALGDKVVRTPTFDYMAENGVLFPNAFSAAPSCAPSRAAVLTGQPPHRLEAAANLWGVFSKKITTYTQLLEQHGYVVGLWLKGWGPGNFHAGGYSQNPAGKEYSDFEEFLSKRDKSKPFSFWYGSKDPHRTYDTQLLAKSHLKARIDAIKTPKWLPDDPVVREDIANYMVEVERFDKECGQVLKLLEQEDILDNTLIIMTSDNGMPFPGAKATLYDGGTRVPFVLMWKNRDLETGMISDAFVNLYDLAPTFLNAAGIDIPSDWAGRDIMKSFQGIKEEWSSVFLERERHAYSRKDNLGYPSRAIRTDEYLYIWNFEPDRWPCGDPEPIFSVGPYGDVDTSPTKTLFLDKGKTQFRPLFQRSFDKRPEEELYILADDPYQLNNVATKKENVLIKRMLRQRLKNWMWNTKDPRAFGNKGANFDQMPYYGTTPLIRE